MSSAQLLVVGAYVAALIVLFATDLDQRLLPNVITYPLIVLALVVFATGASPFVHTSRTWPGRPPPRSSCRSALFLLAMPFGERRDRRGRPQAARQRRPAGRRARTCSTASSRAPSRPGSWSRSCVFIRRLTLKSFVPYGPFLIAGTLWAILALPQP